MISSQFLTEEIKGIITEVNLEKYNIEPNLELTCEDNRRNFEKIVLDLENNLRKINSLKNYY